MDLMPEQGTNPVNKYLPPRIKDTWGQENPLAPYLDSVHDTPTGFLGWIDSQLSRLPSGSKEGSE